MEEENGEELEELQQRARQEKVSLSIMKNTRNVFLKKNLNLLQKEINATGGGTFRSTLDSTQHRLLSILDENIRPMENVYDDANIYFGKLKVSQSPLL